MLIAPGYTPSLFSLHKRFKDELTARSPEWKSVMAEFTFMRTYSRRKPSGSLETWAECVIRVIEGMFTVLKTHAKSNMTPWDEKRAQKHAQEAAERMFSFKWLPPGRGLWIMGTPFMWEKGGAALNNCGFVSTEKMVLSDGVVDEELTAPFRFLMDMSMLGVGVGFDTKAAEHKIPIVGWDTTVEYRMVVEDSREGWVDYMVEVLRACVRGHPMVVPDVSKVRPEGAPIKGFGGVASGPGPLIHLGAGIADVLNSNVGGHITSTIITDIMNLIGKCVVAGNVRRTAEIAFGELEDEDFATLKDWSTNPVEMGSAAPEEMRLESPKDFEAFNSNLWNPSSGVCSALTKKYADRSWAYKLGGWRWCSNNSVFARVGMDYEKYEKSIGESGEPGFAWLDLMRSHGRMKDAANNRDHRVMGGNPCLEQSLESYELCCLVETFPSHAEDYWDFQRTLKFAYLYAKAVSLMGTHFERTNAIVIRNRRIGTSMSGVVDAIQKFGRTKFMQEFCDRGYDYVCYVDKKYSEWLGVPESIKKTSNKPSGTVSLLASVFGPGVHWPKMRTGYRLIRLASNSEYVDILRASGFRIEPSVSDPIRTVVVYFPWLIPDGIPADSEVSIWEKFKLAADMQYWWADNQVSCTVEFTQAELDRHEISRCLEAFDGQIKGISLLPSADGVYPQMPFTKAPREEVEAYAATLKPVDFSSLTREGDNAESNKFCDSEGCLI